MVLLNSLTSLVPKNLLRDKARERVNKKKLFLGVLDVMWQLLLADFLLGAGAVATNRLSFAPACIRKSRFLNDATGYVLIKLKCRVVVIF